MDRLTACGIFSRLKSEYCTGSENTRFLDGRTPFEILVLTILSARTTDSTVNNVRDKLFSHYPNPLSLAEADPHEVEKIIHPTGFYRAKARNIIGASEMVCNEYQGKVPSSMEALLRLPGVGRKTANIVLDHAFSLCEGIAVDTHVRRIAMRTGMTEKNSPAQIEVDLMALYPREAWNRINYLFISHGRAVCRSQNPACKRCIISGDCRYYQSRDVGVIEDKTRQTD